MSRQSRFLTVHHRFLFRPSEVAGGNRGRDATASASAAAVDRMCRWIRWDGLRWLRVIQRGPVVGGRHIRGTGGWQARLGSEWCVVFRRRWFPAGPARCKWICVRIHRPCRVPSRARTGSFRGRVTRTRRIRPMMNGGVLLAGWKPILTGVRPISVRQRVDRWLSRP
jgi:hypothetical protein